MLMCVSQPRTGHGLPIGSRRSATTPTSIGTVNVCQALYSHTPRGGRYPRAGARPRSVAGRSPNTSGASRNPQYATELVPYGERRTKEHERQREVLDVVQHSRTAHLYAP